MGRVTTVTVDSEKMDVTDVVRTGRNKLMSILNLNLNFSHFRIDICVNRDEEKRKEKIRKIIEHDKRLQDIMEERNKLNTEFMRINM